MELLAQQKVLPVWGWSLVLIAIVAVALVVVVWVRRRLTAPVDGLPQNFTLDGLRKMRDDGQIDEQQFQKLREAIIGSSKR